ncbi:MAG: endonuclease/exonuclease/phosphatase family protein [Candidatus Hydrogenedentes bacterium]|nr:endonuclease/exonuclease/phosphatase family protein [Candidatus Hydrogenedentota bacterium]
MAESFTLVTYNVHGCRGLDGRRSEARVARVLMDCGADVIALQELDAARSRSAFIGQPRELAARLEMDYCFVPTAHWDEGEYGCAILSRLPMRHVKSAALPARGFHEPRGALWVEIDVRGHAVQVVNTHLDYQPTCCSDQLEALLGDTWIGNERFRPPGVVCGDFNFTPGSRLYRHAAALLTDAAVACGGARATWMGLRRLDYVWTSADVHAESVSVVRTMHARVASDHAPVVARLWV